MKFFGRKAARGSARPALARGFGVAFGCGEWPRSYEAQVREAYAQNAVAQRAVRLVTESLGQAPLVCSEPEVAALLGGEALLEAVATYLLLHGNAFVEVLTDDRGNVAQLFALRPERVTVEADARGWPAAYLYKVGEVTQRLDAEGPRPALLHIKAFHPLDDHYGLGCLGAAAGAVGIHNAATRWNKALLDNAARPSGALVYEPEDGVALSSEQFERLRGRRGTGWAEGSHTAGERFVLIEEESLRAWDAPLSALGGTLRLMASGVGDETPAETSITVAGEALRPPAPAQFVARRQTDGGFALGWSRGSRAGWRWVDGTDVPLAEERETYRLTITRGDGAARTVELGSAAYVYSAAEAAADRTAGPAVTFVLVQIGTHAVSRPAQLILQLD